MSWTMTKEEYEQVKEQLATRLKGFDSPAITADNCLHKSCQKCSGVGVDKDGQACIHMISCPCKNCSAKA